MSGVIELKDPKTDRVVHLDPNVSVGRFLLTFRYWFATAFMLGHYLLGGVGVICIILAIVATTDADWKLFALPFALLYVAIGTYVSLNIGKMTVRSYQRRGWLTAAGDPDGRF